MSEETIFLTALEEKDAAARAAYLDRACGGDAELRRRVEALLRSHADPDSFLDVPSLVRQARQEGHGPTATFSPAGGVGPDAPTDTMSVGPEDKEAKPDPNQEVLALLAPPQKSGSLGRLDHYEILDNIGRGGMGVVLKGWDTKLRRIVAIKVLAPQLAANGTARQRFIREAQAAAAVRDEHVVSIHAVNDERAVPYLVMEYIAGVTLAGKVKKGGALEVKEVLRIGLQAAKGLAAAHAQGLIHRDVTPGNILLENGVQRVKLTDFGLARALDDGNLSQQGIIAGTPLYMSPEQARGEKLDQRSDLFSLGSVLYTLCTGRAAFGAGNTLAIMKRVCEESPRPVREVNADIPDWLAAIIEKLMAKNPDDRIQTATELADTLAEHLARLQQSGLAATSTLPASPRPRSRSRVAVPLILALLALIAVSAAVTSWWLLTPSGNPSAKNPTSSPGKDLPSPPKKPGLADPKVLTVSKKPEDGGQYRAINAALDEVTPGMTIRVLDDEVYEENLRLDRPEQYRGIVLEAAGKATISGTDAKATVETILIKSVSGVTLRGFRIKGVSGRRSQIGLFGHCPGAVLDGLDITAPTDSDCVNLLAINLSSNDHPVIIQNCTMHQGVYGVIVEGRYRDDFDRPNPTGNIIIRNNTIDGPIVGIALNGAVKRVQIVGNRFLKCGPAAMSFEDLLTGSADLLLANNTFWRNYAAVRIMDDASKGDECLKCKNVRVANNLVLETTFDCDMAILDHSRGDDNKVRNGNVKKLMASPNWRFDHNWRESKKPKPESPYAGRWLPPSALDQLQPWLEGLNRKPSDPGFLRPPKGSPLGAGGAGTTDPSLPAYVGAFPPEGVEPWDWDTTWKALLKQGPSVPIDPMVLTVSQMPKDGGQYRTINEALGKATKAGMTIRVLDDAVYTESLELTHAGEFKDLTLESPHHATLQAPSGTKGLKQVTIKGIAGLTFRGFKLRGDKDVDFFVWVEGECPGLALEQLDFDGSSSLQRVIGGIAIGGVTAGANGPKIDIRNNVLRHLSVPIFVCGCGGPANYQMSYPCGQISISENLITDCLDGIRMHGSLAQIQVAGNKFHRTIQSGIHMENLLPGSKDLLIANNTFLESTHALRLWDSAPKGENIRVCNNLFLGTDDIDMLFVDSKGFPDGHAAVAGDGLSVTKKWSFANNWRELNAAKPQKQDWIPPTKTDKVLKQIDVLSRKLGDPNFLRPPNGSPLATDGAGATDPALPAYVGAVPPEAVASWDWDKTWKALITKDKKAEVGVLTVSQKEADGGKFRTIGAALANVKPGETIRVLDKAVYKEYLRIDQADQFAGITLEAVNGATLQATGDAGKTLAGVEVLVQIKNVPRVTIRGLRCFRAASAGKLSSGVFVEVVGKIPGTRLEKLEFDGDEEVRAVMVNNPGFAAKDAPVLVRGCIFHGCHTGVLVSTPAGGGNTVVCENLFVTATQGCMVFGSARKVLVLGNRFVECGAAMTAQSLYPGAGDLLFANNTTRGCRMGFRFWDEKPRGENIHVCNNLFLGPHGVADMAFVDNGGAVDGFVGPGDVNLIAKYPGWKFAHNWREAADKPTPANVPFRIPKAKTDHEEAEIALLSRDVTHPDFLRPAKDSPLATAGDGINDPPLPAWVGAVPPAGMEWDWQKTWKALAK